MILAFPEAAGMEPAIQGRPFEATLNVTKLFSQTCWDLRKLYLTLPLPRLCNFLFILKLATISRVLKLNLDLRTKMANIFSKKYNFILWYCDIIIIFFPCSDECLRKGNFPLELYFKNIKQHFTIKLFNHKKLTILMC